MRKLIYAINFTLDACCEHTQGIVDDELLDYYTALVGGADLIVYGRKTYELMVPYWPDILKKPAGETKADVDYARAFESVDKIVFSRTLHKAEGSKTSIVQTDLRDEILKLKQEGDGYILVGGVDLPSQLTTLGLIDEYRFVVHPIIAGGGRRLFEGATLAESLRLKLVDSKNFENGQVALTYLKPITLLSPLVHDPTRD